jgi:hypothetical protein
MGSEAASLWNEIRLRFHEEQCKVPFTQCAVSAFDTRCLVVSGSNCPVTHWLFSQVTSFAASVSDSSELIQVAAALVLILNRIRTSAAKPHFLKSLRIFGFNEHLDSTIMTQILLSMTTQDLYITYYSTWLDWPRCWQTNWPLLRELFRYRRDFSRQRFCEKYFRIILISKVIHLSNSITYWLRIESPCRSIEKLGYDPSARYTQARGSWNSNSRRTKDSYAIQTIAPYTRSNVQTLLLTSRHNTDADARELGNRRRKTSTTRESATWTLPTEYFSV